MAKPFVCPITKDGYLVRKPRDGDWPAFSQDLNASLKFRSEDEAVDWLRINRVNGVGLCWRRLPSGLRRRRGVYQ